jgi:hypothetical protein
MRGSSISFLKENIFNFMKSIELFFLLINFSWLYCTSRSAHPTMAPTATNTPQPTITSTATLTPTLPETPIPTEAPRFVELLFQTLDECKQNNVIRKDNEHWDLALLLGKVKDLNIDPSTLPYWNVTILISGSEEKDSPNYEVYSSTAIKVTFF